MHMPLAVPLEQAMLACRIEILYFAGSTPGRDSDANHQRFLRYLIQIFWNDHAPPHFHALYAEHEVLVDIRTLEVIEGSVPRRALSLILEWAQEHRAELMEDWELCARRQSPKKIQPLT
jgi:hypothetical protein